MREGYQAIKMKVLSLISLLFVVGLIFAVSVAADTDRPEYRDINYHGSFQGPKRPKSNPVDSRSKENPSSGPKRPKTSGKENEPVRVITKTEFRTIEAKANKGYLSVVAVPAASVRLIPVGHKGSTTNAVIKDEEGTLNLINLVPGAYNIVIEHEDYLPYSEPKKIEPGVLDTMIALSKMTSKYGVIRIGGVPADAKIYLDDKQIDLSTVAKDNQNIVLKKVPVKKYSLKVSKGGYDDFTSEVDVLPGKEQFIAASLESATVKVSLISQPYARVYVGNEEKANIPSDGKVMISLPAGRHSIRVLKDGYQEWKKEMTLSLAGGSVIEVANLIPIPNSEDADWEPSQGARKWYPQNADWRFDKSGMAVKSDKVVLFDTEQDRDFNVYQNLKLEFDVVFSNAKGVSWVARAKDPNNYYLFEITLAQGNPTFNFYVCQDGKLQWRDSRQIVESVDKPGDSFHIIFEARGNRFETKMKILSAPSSQARPIGIFHDNSLTYGGVGFCGKDQSISLIQTFFVNPIK